MRQIIKTSGLAVLTLLTQLNFAHASLDLNGSFGFAQGRRGTPVVYSPPNFLALTTSVTLSSVNVLGQVDPTYLGKANDFATGEKASLDAVDYVFFSPSPFTIPVPAGPGGSPTPFVNPTPMFVFGGDSASNSNFQFSSNSLTVSRNGTTDSLSLTIFGALQDTTHTFNEVSAKLSITFGQSGGPTGPVSYSGTFAATAAYVPPNPSPDIVIASFSNPEPATILAALVGVVPFLVAAARRRAAIH